MFDSADIVRDVRLFSRRDPLTLLERLFVCLNDAHPNRSALFRRIFQPCFLSSSFRSKRLRQGQELTSNVSVEHKSLNDFGHTVLYHESETFAELHIDMRKMPDDWVRFGVD
jgi:hypothetical protein